MTTRIDIINRALIEIGQSPVAEDVPPGPSRVLEYETHIGALISSYPWSFQTRLVQLARLTAPPDAQRQYAYDLPSDMPGAPRAAYPNALTRQPTTDYEIRGRQLFTDHQEIWLRYTQTPEPARWPGYFLALAVLVMKAQFALSIREDTVLWRELHQLAFGPPQMQGEGGKFGEAKTIDAGGKPSEVIQIGSNPLIAVRH
jgi:hypothetical protein